MAPRFISILRALSAVAVAAALSGHAMAAPTVPNAWIGTCTTNDGKESKSVLSLQPGAYSFRGQPIIRTVVKKSFVGFVYNKGQHKLLFVGVFGSDRNSIEGSIVTISNPEQGLDNPKVERKAKCVLKSSGQ